MDADFEQSRFQEDIVNAGLLIYVLTSWTNCF